jgi:hypothetical protein
MATLHSVPISRFPSDWETETYSDTTFLSLIENGRSFCEEISDAEIAEMESVTDYMDGEYPEAIRYRFNAENIGDFLFLVTDGEAFPKSASEIRSNLSFPTLDNFCYDEGLLRAQIANFPNSTDRARETLANLR